VHSESTITQGRL